MIEQNHIKYDKLNIVTVYNLKLCKTNDSLIEPYRDSIHINLDTPHHSTTEPCLNMLNF